MSPRVLSYKEVALEYAITEHGCALGQKSQVVDIPLYDVPKSVPNEESVTGATNKDDAGSSKTSQSDVENAAAPSRKGDSQEGMYAIFTSQGPGGEIYGIF